MITILAKEVSAYLHSLIGYVVIGFFLIGMGFLVWVYPGSNVLDYGYADLSAFFTLGPYVMMFLMPAVTMRTFSEEKRAGTFDLLITHPLSDWQIVLGKYVGSVFIFLLCLLLTSSYYITLYYLGSPVGNVDTPGTIGSYMGLALLGAVFAAFGLLGSAVTTNQVIAFILSSFLCYLAYEGISALSELIPAGQTSLFIEELSLSSHYVSLGKGLVQLTDVVYMAGMAYLGLAATKFTLSKRNW